MLTKEQIRSTKEAASADVKYWFTGHQAQTKLVEKPVTEPDELGAIPDSKTQYERVPMSIAEYIQEKLGYLVDEKYKARLIKQFGYTEETIKEKLELYNESFWRCHALRQKNTDKHEKVLAKYKAIFDEAEKVAATVDISDINDGFPCGSVHLYLAPEMQDTDLGKAIAFKNGDSSTDAYKYQLPIKMKNPGQCISFTERICKAVKAFLDNKGVPVREYSWID